MSRRAPPRWVARTLLLVGEGDAEVLFLKHLKALYVQRGSGVAVTIKNAHGKGAGHVVDYAIRQSRNAAYDAKAALLDTDTNWNDHTRALARKGKVEVMPCEPCLEAVLLAVHRAPFEGRNTTQLKQDFATRFGAAASDDSVLRHFGADVLEAARPRLPVLQQVFDLLLQKSK